MIIDRVNTKNFLRQLHDAVYGSLDRSAGFRTRLENPSDWVKEQVDLAAYQKPHLKKAYRVALLFSYYQQFVYDLEDRGDTSDLITGNIDKLLSCEPYGVHFSEAPRTTEFSCKLYSVCPWCRLRKSHELAQKLIPLLREAKQMAHITLSFPASFLTGEHPLAELTDEIGMASIKKEHTAMVNTLCKKKGLFFADRVITLPNWRKTSDVNDPVTRYSFNIETTIIGLMNEKKELPLPENCISEARQKTMPFFGVGRGTWSILKPTQKSLQQIISDTMGFSPALLSKNLDLDEYITAFELQSNFRSVGHGKAR